MTDLLVLGGTVVGATGSARADVAIRGGRIEAVGPDLSGLAESADEVVDATGLLVLPGVIDVHTHTRVATRRRAGSLLPGFRGRGVRRDDDVPRVQQPRDRIVAGGAAIDPDRYRRVPAGHGERLGGGLRRQPGDPRRHGRPDRRAAGDGRCRRSDREGVHGLRLPPRRPGDLRGDAGARRPRRDAPAPLRGPGPDRHGDRGRASAW